eukprot:11152646-Heterocapsa_arctica.AAC.1
MHRAPIDPPRSNMHGDSSALSTDLGSGRIPNSLDFRLTLISLKDTHAMHRLHSAVLPLQAEQTA